MFRGYIVFWHVLTNESPWTVALARCSEAVIFKGGCSVHVFTDCGAPARWRCSGKIIISERCIRQFLSMFAGCCFHEMISGCYMFCLHFALPLYLCWLSRPVVNKLLKCRPVSTFTESYYGVNDIWSEVSVLMFSYLQWNPTAVIFLPVFHSTTWFM